MYNNIGENMQKYKLIYENENEICEIPLRRYHENYESELEICFIDAFTTVFQDEEECIKHLYDKNFVPDKKGSLYIKRPNGKVSSLDIIYNNLDFREISYKLEQSLRNGDTSRLPQTSELNSCTGPLIRYFIDDEKAFEVLKKTFGYKKDNIEFLKHLDLYLGLLGKGFYTPEEMFKRENERKYIYSKLSNYNFLRELLVWTSKYKNGKIIISLKEHSTWKNPYEEYERIQEERHHTL